MQQWGRLCPRVCVTCVLGRGCQALQTLGLLRDKGRRAEGGTLPLRRCAHSRRGGGRSATGGCAHPVAATNAATATAAGLRPRRSAGGRGPSDSAQCPPRRRPGRMLQMVKTLAQFTIALEDMRDLGPAAASGESAGGGGSDTTEEPGEAQVLGGGGAAGNLGLGLGCRRPSMGGGGGGMRGQMLESKAWDLDQTPGACLPACQPWASGGLTLDEGGEADGEDRAGGVGWAPRFKAQGSTLL